MGTYVNKMMRTAKTWCLLAYRYELLSKVASKYCSSVTEKLGQIEQLERDLDVTAQSLAQSVEEIDSSARKAQERLERHFAGETEHSSVIHYIKEVFPYIVCICGSQLCVEIEYKFPHVFQSCHDVQSIVSLNLH